MNTDDERDDLPPPVGDPWRLWEDGINGQGPDA